MAERDTCLYLNVSLGMARRAAAAADRIDDERRLPPELAADMADKGLFRLLVPRSLGGAELDYADYLRIVDVFARADGSTAWCVNQNNVFATDAVRMPVETAREIWADPRAVISNGPPTPSTVAFPTPGGYRVTGRWNFSSGIRHASWVAALAPLKRLDEGGQQPADHDQEVVLLIPKDHVEVLDVWQVNGLRGTGSFSFQAEDLSSRPRGLMEPTTLRPRVGPCTWSRRSSCSPPGFATVALGVARSALDAAIDIASEKVPVKRTSVLRDTSTTQRQVGEAEALWRSARAFLMEAAGALWESAVDRGALAVEERIRLRLASTHGIRTAAQVVAVAYDVAGSGGIFKSNPVQRRLQDVQAITQQVQGRMTHYDTAGPSTWAWTRSRRTSEPVAIAVVSVQAS